MTTRRTFWCACLSAALAAAPAQAQAHFRIDDATVQGVPTTVGLGFADGELGYEPRSTSTGQAVTVTRRWESGAPLHVVAHGVFPAGRNITLSAREAEGRTLQATDIAARGPRAAVDLGDDGVVRLSDLLDRPFEVTYASPSMVEVWYRGRLGRMGLEAAFQVRLFDNDVLWLRVVLERPDRRRGVSHDKRGHPVSGQIRIGDRQVARLEGFPVYRNASFSWQRYLGAEQYTHSVWQDTERLQLSGLVPHYGWTRRVPEGYLDKLAQSYRPGTLGNYKKTMGAGGVTFELGPVTGWAARWLQSGGDARAWRAIIANARAFGLYPVMWRDDGGQMLAPDDSPGIAYNGKNGSGTNALTNGEAQWDEAHNLENYVAYLITGDSYFRDLMLGNGAALYMAAQARPGQSHGAGTGKWFRAQIRGTAWVIRAIGMIATLLPDGHPDLPQWRQLLHTQVRKISRAIAKAPDSTLGVPWTVYTTKPGTPVRQRPWMHNFWAWAVSFIALTDALHGERKAEMQRAARWMLQSIVGQLGEEGGFCTARAGSYSLKYSDHKVKYLSQVNLADRLYRSWGELYRANFGDQPCGDRVIGYQKRKFDLSSVNNYVVQMMPAIAMMRQYAVEGAEAAWTRLTRMRNFGDLRRVKWAWAGWGVTPLGVRLDAAVDPPARRTRRAGPGSDGTRAGAAAGAGVE